MTRKCNLGRMAEGHFLRDTGEPTKKYQDDIVPYETALVLTCSRVTTRTTI